VSCGCKCHSPPLLAPNTFAEFEGQLQGEGKRGEKDGIEEWKGEGKEKGGKRIRGFAFMRYINPRLTLTLTKEGIEGVERKGTEKCPLKINFWLRHRFRM